MPALSQILFLYSSAADWVRRIPATVLKVLGLYIMYRGSCFWSGIRAYACDMRRISRLCACANHIWNFLCYKYVLNLMYERLKWVIPQVQAEGREFRFLVSLSFRLILLATA